MSDAGPEYKRNEALFNALSRLKAIVRKLKLFTHTNIGIDLETPFPRKQTLSLEESTNFCFCGMYDTSTM